MAKRLYVDRDECITCESCVEICPQVFQIVDDDHIEVIDETCEDPCVEEAIDICPVSCIHWADD